ncbi:MurR/RpiR family transcriptional regulator [Trichococcus collinsii]|uniref:Transcriptional regulator, RpiR family n=1 Tax=Trichococcus collinsii TaxID=157076 RepID=A0AB38A0F6_9LACT|nr:MurR/RpiR family transcriptional regulator [Trichococcus collinsii]CZQ89829.1 sugar isomerase (sis) [Trichococcus collinsii]SEA49667.1 transcriptional regulator, RpiR family [Trichococcus collinsii]
MGLAHLIQEKYHALTKSEKRIADYLLANKEQAVYQTMKDVTEAVKVGDATLIRFSQKIGFNGFSDLKIAIAKEEFTSQYEGDNDHQFYDRILENQIKVLESTRQLLDSEVVLQAIEAITKAKRIYIIGVGSSGLSAASLEKMLLRVGVHANHIVDPHFQAHALALLGPEDLVICFSLSGRTKDIHDSLKIAKENHTPIVAITNFKSSPIAELGDIVLQTANEEFFDGGSLAGKISQLYISETLVRGYEIKNKIETVELREKVLRSIIDKRLD